MPSSLQSGIAAALVDAFAQTDQTFTWRGKNYGCVINRYTATIITSTALFPDADRPKVGESIGVLGSQVQILSVEGSDAQFVQGGYVRSGVPRVGDDNMSPAFEIRYGAFVKG